MIVWWLAEIHVHIFIYTHAYQGLQSVCVCVCMCDCVLVSECVWVHACVLMLAYVWVQLQYLNHLVIVYAQWFCPYRLQEMRVQHVKRVPTQYLCMYCMYCMVLYYKPLTGKWRWWSLQEKCKLLFPLAPVHACLLLSSSGGHFLFHIDKFISLLQLVTKLTNFF